MALAIDARAADDPRFAPAARLLSPNYRQLEDRERALHAELAALPLPPVSQQSERIGWHSHVFAQSQRDEMAAGRSGARAAVRFGDARAGGCRYGTYPGPGFGFPVRSASKCSTTGRFRNRACWRLSTVKIFRTREMRRSFYSPREPGTLCTADGDAALAAAIRHCSPWRSRDPAGEMNIAAEPRWRLATPTTTRPPGSRRMPRMGRRRWGAGQVMPTPGNGWHATIAKAADTVKWVQVDLGGDLPLDEVRLYPARPKDFPARRGFWLSRALSRRGGG